MQFSDHSLMYMSKLVRNIRRGRRALRRYGFLRTAIYTMWALACYPRLGIPRSLTRKMLSGFARLFRVFGVRSIPVTVNGAKIHIDPTDSWSLREYALKPHYDFREISAVRQCVPDMYTFIDVGANFGVWSFSLATHFSKVLAVEPDSRCYQCCKQTCKALRLSNVDIVNVALADHDGDGSLFPSASHIGDSRIYNPGDADRLSGMPVKLITFDSLVSHHQIDTERVFIKLDVQGSEPWVVQGMSQSLSRSKDVILFTEIQQSILAAAGSSIDSYLTLLRQLGFMPVDLFNSLCGASWEDVLDSRSTARDYCFRLSR